MVNVSKLIRHVTFPDFPQFRIFKTHILLKKWISVPAFCKTLNWENWTSDTCLIFKVLRGAGTGIYSLLVKYKSFENIEFRKKNHS